MIEESQKENDLFFTCSLIEYIARKTKNTKRKVVEKLGKENIKKIYELAEVYHCENIEKVSDEFIKNADIKIGTYDVVSNCKYNLPTYWDIGKVYKRLIIIIAVCIMKIQNIYISVMLKVKFYNEIIS